MQQEAFSIVDKDENHVSVAFGEHNLRLSSGYHKAVHVFIEVFGRKFLLQKKARGTEYEGKWSSAASGNVMYNETYTEAAIRVSKDKLGLVTNLEDLDRITKIPPSHENKYGFTTLFTYLMNPKTEALTLNPLYVEEIAVAKLDDIIEDVEKCMDEYSPVFVELFNVFLALSKGVEGASNE